MGGRDNVETGGICLTLRGFFTRYAVALILVAILVGLTWQAWGISAMHQLPEGVSPVFTVMTREQAEMAVLKRALAERDIYLTELVTGKQMTQGEYEASLAQWYSLHEDAVLRVSAGMNAESPKSKLWGSRE